MQERPLTPSDVALQRAMDAGVVRRSPRDGEPDSRHNPSLPSHLRPLTKPQLTIIPPEVDCDDGWVAPLLVHQRINMWKLADLSFVGLNLRVCCIVR